MLSIAAVALALVLGNVGWSTAVAPATKASRPDTVQAASYRDNPCSGYVKLTRTRSDNRTYTLWFPSRYPGLAIYNCYLWRGMPKNHQVSMLQSVYNACYASNFGFRLAVDGRFGERTQKAVRRIQRYHHVSDDGIYGPQTHYAMDWLYWHDYRHAGWPQPQNHSHCFG